MAHVERSPNAERDLIEIGLYIAERSGSHKTAYRFLDTINQTCNLLAAQPEMGQLRKEFVTGQYRSFSVGNYVIYYQPIVDGIQVARILHGARDHNVLI